MIHMDQELDRVTKELLLLIEKAVHLALLKGYRQGVEDQRAGRCFVEKEDDSATP